MLSSAAYSAASTETKRPAGMLEQLVRQLGADQLSHFGDEARGLNSAADGSAEVERAKHLEELVQDRRSRHEPRTRRRAGNTPISTQCSPSIAARAVGLALTRRASLAPASSATRPPSRLPV